MQRYDISNYKLFVYDANGKIKHQFPLEFLRGSEERYASVAVNRDKNILIACCVKDEYRIYVCDNGGQLKYSFPVEDTHYLNISHKNEVITVKYRGNAVYIRTEEGKFKQAFEVPRHHEIFGVTFNYITKKIILHTKITDDFKIKSSYLL